MMTESPGDEAQQLFQAAQTASRQNQTASAVAIMRQVLALAPLNPLYLRAFGELLLAQNNFSQAADAFEKALASDPESP
jgi:predicted Zn-dependent protease